MLRFGLQIGKKFLPDGSAARYPGNTVISDVRPGNPAYDAMRRCRQMVTQAGLDDLFIPMPQDSYHMTVFRGLNDLVRTNGFWPASLAKDATLAEMDAFVAAAVGRVPAPEGVVMRFTGARISAEDFRACLAPADNVQNARLRAYRDAAAEALGLFLPGHAEYTFHITLAYTLFQAEGEQKNALDMLESRMSEFLLSQSPFKVDAPRLAYYEDMLAFHDARGGESIERRGCP